MAWVWSGCNPPQRTHARAEIGLLVNYSTPSKVDTLRTSSDVHLKEVSALEGDEVID